MTRGEGDAPRRLLLDSFLNLPQASRLIETTGYSRDEGVITRQRASLKFASMNPSLLQRVRCPAQDPSRIQRHSE